MMWQQVFLLQLLTNSKTVKVEQLPLEKQVPVLTKFKYLIDEVFRAITKEEVESDKSDIPIDPVKDKKLKTKILMLDMGNEVQKSLFPIWPEKWNYPKNI